MTEFSDTRQMTSPNENLRGEIKLSVQYHRGALTVMVNSNFHNKNDELWANVSY